MARPRYQQGHLYKRGPSWFGGYRFEPHGGRRKTRSVKLGRVSDMTEAQARVALRGVIEADERGTKAARFVGPSSLVRVTSDKPQIGSSTGSKGAASELCVAVDLLRKGYHVFRAFSPGAACDLIAMRDDGQCVRVEVKTATVVNGRVFCDIKGQIGKFDLLALVFPHGLIRYLPQVEIKNDRYPLAGIENLDDFASTESAGTCVGNGK